MSVGYVKTGVITLVSGPNVIVADAAVPAGKVLYLHELFAERTDMATPVTLIFQDTAATPAEVLPRIELNTDAGKVYLSFERVQIPDRTRIHCAPGLGFVVDASVDSKAKFWMIYSIGDPLE